MKPKDIRKGQYLKLDYSSDGYNIYIKVHKTSKAPDWEDSNNKLIAGDFVMEHTKENITASYNKNVLELQFHAYNKVEKITKEEWFKRKTIELL